MFEKIKLMMSKTLKNKYCGLSMRDLKRANNYYLKKIGIGALYISIFFLISFALVQISRYIEVRSQLMLEEYESEEEERQKITTETIYLASINLTNEVEGHIGGGFALGIGFGSGKYSENQYYVAYRIIDDGGKVLFKIPVEEAIIYDVLESGEQAYMEIDSNFYGVQGMTRIYVPKETIYQEYDLSLE